LKHFRFYHPICMLKYAMLCVTNMYRESIAAVYIYITSIARWALWARWADWILPRRVPCVWKLDFKLALAYIRLSNIEFSSRGVDFFLLWRRFTLKNARRVTTIQNFDTNDINQWKVKLIITIICMILFVTIYNMSVHIYVQQYFIIVKLY